MSDEEKMEHKPAQPIPQKDLGVGTLSETLEMIRTQMEKEIETQNHAHDTKAQKEDEEAKRKQEEEDKIIALTPAQRSAKYYERAKALYTRGGGTSLELEIIIRDVALAANFVNEDPKMFYFLAKVFKQQLDFNSSIYALRNVLRIDDKNRAARIMLGDVLFRRAQEIMGDAAIMDRQIQANTKTQDEVWRQYISAKASAEEKLAKQEAYTRQRKSALAIAMKLRGTPAAGTVHVPPDIVFEDVEMPSKPILLRVPKRVQAFVAEQYRLACGLFAECLEYDRDNFKAIMAKAVCHVYAEEFNTAAENVTRAIHLCNVNLKELQPVGKSVAPSSQGARDGSQQDKSTTEEKFAEMNDDLGSATYSNPPKSPPPGSSHTTLHNIYYSEYTFYPTDEIANEVMKLSRQVGEMLILRGKSYGAMGLTEKGNEDMRKANSIIPEHPECVKFGVRSFVRAEKIYNICMRKFKKGDLDEALTLILMACSLSNTDIKLHIMQARIYRAKEELEKAYQAIQRATQLYQGQSDFEMRVPENIVKETNMIYNDIALQCAGKGQYEKAILLLNKVINAESQLARGVQDIDHRFYINRGDCHRAKKQYGQALVDYNTAMSNLVSSKLGASSGIEGARRQWIISTRLSITYYNVACDYFNESAFADAELHLTQAIQNNPKVAEYYLTRGKARYYAGSYQSAYEDFKKTLEMDPKNAEAKKRLEQFANLGMRVDNDDSSKSEKKSVVGMTLDEAKNNHGAIPTIVASKEDVVEAMLYPRSSKKLPDITVAMRSHSAGSRTTPLLPSKDARVVSHRMLMPTLTTVNLKNATDKFHKILDTKHDTTKSIHWTMFKNAQKMAHARSKPPIDRKKQPHGGNIDGGDIGGVDNDDLELESVYSQGGTKKLVPKSYTTAGLKRYSQKQTLKSLKQGGLIAGVITHDKDPYLAGATEGAKKVSGKSFTIDVSARPRPNKFQPKKPKVEANAVETFESINQMQELSADNTSWRDELRRQNDAKAVSSAVDMDLLAALTGGSDSFFDNPASGAGFRTKKQREEEAAEIRAAEKAERKRLRKLRKEELRAENEAALLRATAAMEAEEEHQMKVGELDENGEIFLGKEFLEPEEGESEEDFLRRREEAKAFLEAQQRESGIANLLGGNINFAGFSGHDDDENVSSLIALTEEQELQLAYEERIKAEHEEARIKKQEKLREKLQEQRSFNKLLGNNMGDTSSDEDN